MTQSIAGTLTNLFEACRDVIYVATIGPDEQMVLVSLAEPGSYQAASLVAVGMAIRTPITRPTMGTNRSREQAAEIDVVMSVWVRGGEEAQGPANLAALALQDQLETYLRTGPNNTLGGACRDAFVSGAEMDPGITYQTFDDPDMAPQPNGRVAENTVTVTAFIRY